MNHTEYAWQLAGKKIYAQSWTPENKPKAVVNLVHGLGEHSGRYGRWAGLFCEEGYGFLAVDLLGHGKTEGKRGHVRSYRLLLEQVSLMLEKSQELFPDKPRILYGQSMGGNIVLNYAISTDPPVDCVIASSPWLRLAFPISAVERSASRLLSAVTPGILVKARGIGAERLSHDPEHWESVWNDPLIHRKISARLTYEVMKQGEYALRHVYRINKPLLLMHGDADEITSFRASEEFVRNTSERTRLKIWEGLRHELHNEFEYREIFRYVSDWLKGNSQWNSVPR